MSHDLITDLEARKTYLKVSELAKLLSVGTRTVYDWVEQHKVAALRVGSQVRICPRAAARWLREQSTVG